MASAWVPPQCKQSSKDDPSVLELPREAGLWSCPLTSQQKDEGLGGDLNVREVLVRGDVLGAEHVLQKAARRERLSRPLGG